MFCLLYYTDLGQEAALSGVLDVPAHWGWTLFKEADVSQITSKSPFVMDSSSTRNCRSSTFLWQKDKRPESVEIQIKVTPNFACYLTTDVEYKLEEKQLQLGIPRRYSPGHQPPRVCKQQANWK